MTTVYIALFVPEVDSKTADAPKLDSIDSDESTSKNLSIKSKKIDQDEEAVSSSETKPRRQRSISPKK